MTKANQRKIERLYETKTAIAEFDNDIVKRIIAQKSTYKACSNCGSKINVAYVKSVKCVCCSSSDFGYTKTDNDKLERLKELKKSLEKEISVIPPRKTVTKKTVTTKPVSPVIKTEVEEVEPQRFIAYITEYGANGEAEDSFKEWFEWDCGTPTHEDAAMELRYPVSDIIMVVKG